MRILKRVLLYLLLSATVQATAQGGSLELTVQQGPAGSGRARANFEFDGQGESCVVDTGAWGTVVRAPLASESVVVGKAQTRGLLGAINEAELIQIRELRSKDWTKGNVVIRRTEHLPESCIIGSDFFMNEALSIQLKQGRISAHAVFQGRTHRLNHYGQDGDQRFGFEVSFNGAKVSSLFDTGAELTVIDPRLIAERPRSFEFVQPVEMVDASNRRTQVGLYRVKSMKFGDWEAREFYALAHSLSDVQTALPNVRVILGFNVIAAHHWYIDNVSRRWGIY